MDVLEYVLLGGIVICAAMAPLCKKLLTMVVMYMTFSLMLAVLWGVLQSPDLAITEVAMGAGVTGILFLLTLRRIHWNRDSGRGDDGDA